MPKLMIDSQEISADDGATLLDPAEKAGIDIPVICWHEATTSNGLCRLCVVEVEGLRLLQPACIVKASEGMKVQTRSERVVRARRTILEMLASSVDLCDAPEILDLMKEYGANPGRFPEAERRKGEVKDDNPMYIREYAKCVLCWRCVQVCADDAQYTFAINFSGRGYETQVATFYDRTIPETSCVLCGQCVAVCPTGALKPKREFLLEGDDSPANWRPQQWAEKEKVVWSILRFSTGFHALSFGVREISVAGWRSSAPILMAR